MQKAIVVMGPRPGDLNAISLEEARKRDRKKLEIQKAFDKKHYASLNKGNMFALFPEEMKAMIK